MLQTTGTANEGTTMTTAHAGHDPKVTVSPNDRNVRQDDPHPEPAPGVLIVDDEPAIRELLRLALGSRGWQVWTASDGVQALAAYGRLREHLDLVVLDVHMPGLSGPDTLALLRRLAPRVRCCMVSAFGDFDPDELLERGASAVIHKPFGVNELCDRLNALVRPAAQTV